MLRCPCLVPPPVASLAAAACLALGAADPACAQRAAGAAVAYVIPQQQPDQAALKTLLLTLADHGVEIRRALAPFVSGRVRYSAGAYVVLAAQAHGSVAAGLLEPPLGGPTTNASIAGADTTPIGLPQLLGVGVAAVRDSFPIPVTPPIASPVPRYPTPAGLGDSVRRVIALYVPAGAGRPVAWTRATLERYGVRYAAVDSAAMRDGDGLRQSFDVLLLADAGASPYAALSPAVAAGLRAFVDDGGTIVAIGKGARWVVEALRMPGRFDDIAADSEPTGPPGSGADSALVRLRIDRGSPIVADMVAHAFAWVAGGPTTVYAPDTERVHVVATYDAGEVVAGSATVSRAYNGRAAAVDVPQGHGRVVLFGFDPAYRGASLATLPMLWGALRVRGK
jgi:hypothetical protein